MSLFRTRWAAIGAAVAVTLGGGGVAFVDAAKSSGDKPVTVPLDDPCRLRDTRPDKGVGGRDTPLKPAEAYTVQGTGASGNCNVPADAVGLVTNVTADQATEKTNLRLYPTGGTVPKTSNLNPRPGAAPTPNAVTVGLNGAGQFDIRNANGNVHIIIDVIAYLVDHNHDDRYYQKTEVDQRIPAGVQIVPFEVKMGYESSQTIAENGDLTLSLRCRPDNDTDSLPPGPVFSATNRANMQLRAFSTGKYMTSLTDSPSGGVYSNQGVTIHRALGPSDKTTPVHTNFFLRDTVIDGIAVTAVDGRQIQVAGNTIQVMFNVPADHFAPGSQKADCYARGAVMLLPATP